MRLTLLAALCLTLWACKTGPAKASVKYTQACASDADCVSGHCLDGTDATRFCSQECADDAGCTPPDNATLYCCESLGEKNYCVKPAADCRKPVLLDSCAGPGDPYCARGNMTCEMVGGRLACTAECLSDADCMTGQLVACQAVDTRQLCVPLDAATLPRRTSNCVGDRDCTGPGEICQIDFDNRKDPQQLITVCEADAIYGPQKAYTPCTADKTQCDRFFCMNKFCPAVCLNDSHCAPGFDCRPLQIPISQTQATWVGLCTKRDGSGLPCDAQGPECASGAVCPTGACPFNEACGYTQRFDGLIQTECSTRPQVISVNPPVSSTYSRLDQACSVLGDHDHDPNTPSTYSLVAGEIKQCDNDLCLSTGVCTAPCLADADCPAADTEMLSCVHFDLQPHCERPERTGVGAVDGQPCTGTSPDALCASLFCNAGTCASRKADGETCARNNECKSFACLNSKCQKLCRDDSTCGGAGHVCQVDARLSDVFGTTDPSDDVIDLPAFCADMTGAAGVSCPAPSGCQAAQICRTFTTLGGGLRGVCADKLPSGAARGAACTADAACASGFCLLLSSSAGVCSELCADDSGCDSGTRCMAITNLGTKLDKACGKSPGTSADDAACTANIDCASLLCAEGKCRHLCPAGTVASTGCAGGGVCAAVALSIDSRFTTERFDDLYGIVLACVEGATGFTGDVTGCAAPRQYVFRDVGGSMQGFCLTPIADAKDFGVACRSATECKSGLCVDAACTVPCATTPADTCTSNSCDLLAPAMLGEEATRTSAVAACRKTCSQDSDCGVGRTCSSGPPKFCR